MVPKKIPIPFFFSLSQSSIISLWLQHLCVSFKETNLQMSHKCPTCFIVWVHLEWRNQIMSKSTRVRNLLYEYKVRDCCCCNESEGQKGENGVINFSWKWGKILIEKRSVSEDVSKRDVQCCSVLFWLPMSCTLVDYIWPYTWHHQKSAFCVFFTHWVPQLWMPCTVYQALFRWVEKIEERN